MIYELCQERLPIRLRRRRADGERRGYRGFTQVSRQIRAEFHPLYLKNQFWLKAYEVQKFVKENLPRSMGLDKTVTLVVNIRQRYSSKPLDILPVLLATAGRENIQVYFHCEAPRERLAESLNRVFQNRSRWQALISKVARIFLHHGLTIVFREKGFGEWAAGRDITSVSFWGQMGFKVQLQQYVLFAKLKD